MIKPYAGLITWPDRAQRTVKKSDGFLYGECDLCKAVLSGEASGAMLISQITEDFDDAAFCDNWKIIGRHLICDKCVDKIAQNKIQITIKRKKENVKESEGK